MVTTRSHTSGGSEPPKYLEIPSYNLDLDLPPRHRWKHIIANFPNLHSMVMSLVSQILDEEVPKITHPAIRLLMSTILTKLASEELTEELQGISEVSGCPIWALIAYNIGYDFMAGCTSGGMKTVGEDGKEEMFHYRNLDWHMEETRQTTIKVNYIRGGKTIMEAIHYAGIVGVHTGVRYFFQRVRR
jgi:beta subunit of N-acylethanolamine-hydrolyzing acid amidase